MKKRKISKKKITLKYLCRNCFLKHSNGDCPMTPDLRKKFEDVNIHQMLNTSYACQTVNSIIDENKFLKNKAEEPMSRCQRCPKKCASPLLRGSKNANRNCVIIDYDLIEFINQITNKSIKLK